MPGLPNLTTESRENVVMTPEDEVNIQRFYMAAMERGSTGSEDLDLLLRKGLYGAKVPKDLYKQKAADAFQSAFDLIGGVPRLALWADKNPSAFFALYSKLIPSSIQAQVHATIKVEAPWMNPNRLSYADQSTIDVTPSNGPNNVQA